MFRRTTPAFAAVATVLGTYDQIAEALDQLERCGALRVRTTEACGVPVSGRSLALDDGAAQ